ncbi:MAG TPA: DEAD/DEAH box helicase family protein [Archangium sp.]|uniref:DEAD/DEAH box helicase family protein n=1 Tax=Archangium sp. TaxID=1872627 RepID=UPI002E308F16|nr:DEAD/DEAH box helicase family protein [Archangium sp.]HEX5754209.1 DEAD/DEAH box helicase family protein [Archangium sp.]
MVDFSKYTDDETPIDVSDPLALFDSLDRKTSHVGLRAPQKEALVSLAAKRGTRDLVLKMSTGFGKTTVALVHLYSYMAETRRPVVYLCPTTQLVEQVLQEAENLGISAVYYRHGEKHPPATAIAGQAIIVCTYDKLFNARSTFDRDDVDLIPHAIVLDDAHSGIQEIRDSFTIRIEKGEIEPLFEGLLELLRAPCKDYNPGVWMGVERGDDAAAFEVPFWIWAPLIDQLRSTLDVYAEGKGLLFVWGYLKNNLRWCRCIVSGKVIEIFPDIPAVQLARPYNEAKHRLFMSATLSDDSALVRELGCEPDAARNPIVPPSDGGVGERMVLAPSLIDPTLDRDWVMKWCRKLSKRFRVVVLTPSEKAARQWEAVGATVEVGDRVKETVEGLKKGTLSFVAFAQRYDGVDLPDDSCRVLVIDGMPVGQGLGDDYDRKVPGRPGGAYRRWIYRVEQGMGRAVRSQADYAVVVLTGPDLVNFLAKRDVVELMGATTRAQLQLSEDLTKIALNQGGALTNAVEDMANKCLTRDAGWKSFYDSRVKKKLKGLTDKPEELQILLTEAEHQAQRAAFAHNPQKAADIIQDVLHKVKPQKEQPTKQAKEKSAQAKAKPAKGTASSREKEAIAPPSEEQIGWLLQRKANYIYEVDEPAGLQTQKAAHEKNSYMCTPPNSIVSRYSKPTAAAATVVLSWYAGFSNPNGALAELATLKTKLSFDAKPEILEQGLMDIAVTFGAIGLRPEKQFLRGPDNLWEWPEFSWVIEAKNERAKDLPKSDGEQLLAAMEWFRHRDPEREGIPVVVARSTTPRHDAFFPEGTRVLTPDGLEKLLKNIEQFLGALVKQPPLFWKPEPISKLLEEYKLTTKQFALHYTKPLSKSKAP